jgi:adenylate kinase family enzyme
MISVAKALKTPLTGLNVAIVGLPASGKTYFTGLLSLYNPSHIVFHTDDYLQAYNSVEAMYAALEEVQDKIADGRKTIVEGVAAYRMLRKGVQLETYFPDLVFELIAPDEQRARVYSEQRKERSFVNVQKFDKALCTVLKEYKSTIEYFQFPTWIQVENIF